MGARKKQIVVHYLCPPGFPGHRKPVAVMSKTAASALRTIQTWLKHGYTITAVDGAYDDLSDLEWTVRPARYFIYFTDEAPAHLLALNSGERTYYPSAPKARRAIRCNHWEKFASVEVSE